MRAEKSKAWFTSVKDSGTGIPEDEIPIVLASIGQGQQLDQIGRAGSGPRIAHREEPRRSPWRYVHAQIKTPHRHGGDCHVSSRTRHVGDRAAWRALPSPAGYGTAARTPERHLVHAKDVAAAPPAGKLTEQACCSALCVRPHDPYLRPAPRKQ